MESYKDVKIGVYAICSGEPNEFIDRWLASMSKADYIWVLVTNTSRCAFVGGQIRRGYASNA